ncbi:hypothetical protein BUM88_18285 [Acinetobacter calcoaceticus]|uniref:hypothetical protein n=1 Tax=Acinetobacter calcoaceticus TaxID=471 RepID=UPI0009AE2E07|nr:hypothetical protein [Acinetobacter calcoaceticus]AQZ83386.1 hypothetical protein BUM88_18285 [Acinetobacter calcoaceticus]
MISITEIISKDSNYVSVNQAFDIIKKITNESNDALIAELLIIKDVNYHCLSFDRFTYFNEKPVRLHREYGQHSPLDKLLFKIAESTINTNSDIPELNNYAWDKAEFMFFLDDIFDHMDTATDLIGNRDMQNNELLAEIENLKKTIKKKDKEIFALKKQLSLDPEAESIDILHTRTTNAVAKLILVLTHMAKIDISKPYSPYEALKIHSQQLDIDNFPSKDTVGPWLEKASNFSKL